MPGVPVGGVVRTDVFRWMIGRSVDQSDEVTADAGLTLCGPTGETTIAATNAAMVPTALTEYLDIVLHIVVTVPTLLPTIHRMLT